MADDVWGRARIPTGESVAAALHLARTLKPDDCVLWDRDDGATELLARDGGTVFHHVAHESGTTEAVEVRAATPRYRLGQWMVYCGLLGMPLVIGAAFLFKPEHSDLLIGVPFMLAIGLAWGSMLVQKRPDLDALVPGGVASARIPHDLGGWQPRTVSQLAVVWKLCKAGEGEGYVLEAAEGWVEVETVRKRERHKHTLDAHGTVVGQEVAELSGGVVWAPRAAGLAFLVPLLALLLLDGFRYFVAGVVVCGVIGAVSLAFQRRKHQERPGERWFKVRLEAPAD